MFIVLLVAVNLLSAAPVGYFDVTYMSVGGATLALAAICQTLLILADSFDHRTQRRRGHFACERIAGNPYGLNARIGTALCRRRRCRRRGGGYGKRDLHLGAALAAVVVTLSVMFVTQDLALLVTDKPGGVLSANFANFMTGSAIPNLLPAPLVVLALVLATCGC